MGSLLKGTSKQSLECGRRGLGGGVGGRHGVEPATLDL